MTVSKLKVVLVEPDPFAGTSRKIASYVPGYGESDKDGKSSDEKKDPFDVAMAQTEFVGRPVGGIKAKPNTHAFVQVVDKSGKILKVFNNLGHSSMAAAGIRMGGGYIDDQFVPPDGVTDPNELARLHNEHMDRRKRSADRHERQLVEDSKHIIEEGQPRADVWTDWILTSVRESRAEKTQIVETFGDTYLYAFGEKPRTLEFSGLLMNTLDYNWRSIFWENWDRFFRATKLIDNDARMYIGWDDIVVEGYPLNAVCTEIADMPNAMRFAFVFFVTDYYNISAKTGFSASKEQLIDASRASTAPGGKKLSGTPYLYQNDATTAGLLGKLGGNLLADLISPELDGAAYKKIEAWMGRDAAKIYVEQAGASARDFARSVIRAPYTILAGPRAHKEFLRSFVMKQAFNVTKMFVDMSEASLDERVFGRRGETNAWWGYLSSLTFALTNNPEWAGGTPNNIAPANLDELISRLGYASGAAIGGDALYGAMKSIG